MPSLSALQNKFELYTLSEELLNGIRFWYNLCSILAENAQKRSVGELQKWTGFWYK